MDASGKLAAYINNHPELVGKVVDFNPVADRLYHFDLTAKNTQLDAETFAEAGKFGFWINEKLSANHCRYGIGGYMEHRTIYSRSEHFDTDNGPRRLHLGTDIWAKAGTSVYSPLRGIVHSFKDNNNFGDYGPASILQHDLGGLTLYSLYGHLSRESLQGLHPGQSVNSNQKIGSLGREDENGGWPPHLHFQLMFDMEDNYGDYPGVCRYAEKEKYLKNIPDPQLILNFPKAVNE